MPRAELFLLQLPWTTVLEAGEGLGAGNSLGKKEEHIH